MTITTGRRPAMRRRMAAACATAGVAALLAGLLGVPAASAETVVPTPSASAAGSVDNAPTGRGIERPVEAPAIKGNPVVGGTLTSTGGVWADAAWIRYTWMVGGVVSVTDEQPVGKASTFKLTNGMAGRSISLRVEAATDANGPYSPGTDAASSLNVGTGTFQNVAWSGTVTGTAKVGQSLSVAAPLWKGPFGMAAAVSYQWSRGGTAIAGAKGRSYVAVPADLGQQLTVRATLSLPGYATLTLSSKGVKVASGTFATAPVPTVTGTARVGKVQSARAGNWSPAGASLGYQWYRGSAAITGATKASYTTVAADSGKALKVRVRAGKAGFVSIDKFSAARTIGAGTITPTKSVKVTGTFRFGNTLRVSQGWSPAPAAIKYQWYKNGKAIKGGTGSYLYLNSSYIGSKISVQLTVSRAGFTTRSTSTVRTLVRNAVFVTKVPPKITGTPKAGSVLTAGNGTHSPAPTSVSYQWYRNGAAISGARQRSYKVTSADNGKSITVRATVSKKLYDSKAVASAAVVVPKPPVTVLRGDGTYRVGSNIKPGLYKATGTGNGCYWERLSGFSGSFSQIKANHFGTARTYVQILAGDVGFSTSGCGAWTTVPATGAKAGTIKLDGSYRVGIDILPGTYFGSGAGSSCYWETVSGFSGDFGAVMENYFGSAWTIIDVPASAKGFTVSGCGTLVRR